MNINLHKICNPMMYNTIEFGKKMFWWPGGTLVIRPPSWNQNGRKSDMIQKRAPTLKCSLDYALTIFEEKFRIHTGPKLPPGVFLLFPCGPIIIPNTKWRIAQTNKTIYLYLISEALPREIFVRRNYLSGKIFVTQRKIGHFRPTKNFAL